MGQCGGCGKEIKATVKRKQNYVIGFLDTEYNTLSEFYIDYENLLLTNNYVDLNKIINKNDKLNNSYVVDPFIINKNNIANKNEYQNNNKMLKSYKIVKRRNTDNLILLKNKSKINTANFNNYNIMLDYNIGIYYNNYLINNQSKELNYNKSLFKEKYHFEESIIKFICNSLHNNVCKNRYFSNNNNDNKTIIQYLINANKNYLKQSKNVINLKLISTYLEFMFSFSTSKNILIFKKYFYNYTNLIRTAVIVGIPSHLKLSLILIMLERYLPTKYKFNYPNCKEYVKNKINNVNKLTTNNTKMLNSNFYKAKKKSLILDNFYDNKLILNDSIANKFNKLNNTFTNLNIITKINKNTNSLQVSKNVYSTNLINKKDICSNNNKTNNLTKTKLNNYIKDNNNNNKGNFSIIDKKANEDNLITLLENKKQFILDKNKLTNYNSPKDSNFKNRNSNKHKTYTNKDINKLIDNTNFAIIKPNEYSNKINNTSTLNNKLLIKDIDKIWNNNNIVIKYNKCNSIKYIDELDKTLSISENHYLELESTIEKDIERTFPDEPFFTENNNLTSLKKLLLNISILDEDLGYLQGMNFIAGVCLIITGNNLFFSLNLFNMLMNIKSNYLFNYKNSTSFNLRTCLLNNFKGLNTLVLVFNNIFKYYYNQVYEKFIQLGVIDLLWVSKWIITLYSVNFNKHLIIFFWEIYSFFGFDSLLFISLFFIEEFKNDLLSDDVNNIDEVLTILYKAYNFNLITLEYRKYLFSYIEKKYDNINLIKDIAFDGVNTS